MGSTFVDALEHDSPAADALIPKLDLWRLSVNDYHEMASHQILLHGDPVELIDGYLVRKKPSPRVPQLDGLSTWCDVISEGGVSRLPVWHLSVDQYHEMLRVGIFKSGDPVELINGLLVRKMTKYSGHRISNTKCRQKLESIAPATTHVQVQEPMRMDQGEPEPDVALVQGAPDDYPHDHPGPADAVLLVEVSDASLRFDQTEKLKLYARNQVKEYWIVNLVDRWVEVYTQPSGPTASPAYRVRKVYGPGQSIPVSWTTGVMLAVDDLFPAE